MLYAYTAAGRKVMLAPPTSITPSLSILVTKAAVNLFCSQKYFKLPSSFGLEKYRLLHFTSTQRLGLKNFVSTSTTSTSPVERPKRQLAYFKFIFSRCIHCEKITVSTMLPASSSDSRTGENIAVRKEGFVKYTLNVVTRCSFRA